MRSIATAFAALLLVASRTTSAVSQTAQIDIRASPTDTGVVSAVLREIVPRSGIVRVRVDPRPLRPGYGVDSPDAGAFMMIADSILAIRIRTVLANGADTADAIVHGQNAQCQGGLTGRESTNAISHVGCPERPTRVVAIGLPLPGHEELPTGQVYERFGRGVSKGYWAIRVIETYMTQTGSSVTACDYVLKLDNGEWRFVQRIALLESH